MRDGEVEIGRGVTARHAMMERREMPLRKAMDRSQGAADESEESKRKKKGIPHTTDSRFFLPKRFSLAQAQRRQPAGRVCPPRSLLNPPPPRRAQEEKGGSAKARLTRRAA